MEGFMKTILNQFAVTKEKYCAKFN